MKLKSWKGMWVGYVEGIILAGLILLAGYWKGYSPELLDLLIILMYPLFILLIDEIFPRSKPSSVSNVVGMMGGLAVVLTLPGHWQSILWGMILWCFFWFIFSKINRELFPQKQEK